MATVNWTNVTTPEAFLQVANDTTGGWFWVSMLTMVTIILMISMLPFGFEAAILGAAFAGLMLGIILAYMNLVAWTWVVMYVGIIVITILWVMYSRRR